MTREERKRRVVAALNGMCYEELVYQVLRYYEGLTDEEIGRVMEISMDRLKSIAMSSAMSLYLGMEEAEKEEEGNDQLPLL